MAPYAFTDAEILCGSLRLTARSNEVDLDLDGVEKDVTTFDSNGWKELLGGIRSMGASVAGLFDVGPVETGALNLDSQLFAEVAASQVPFTIAATKADGSVAYICGTKRGSLSMFGEVGEVAPFESEMWGDGAVARGALIHPANVLRTAGGTGNGVQLGTVAAGRQLLVAIHVVAVSGTTPALTITVQRDDNVGFTTPTTVTTLGPTAVPANVLFPVAGPITPDDRYRITWTLTGTTPSARFGVAVGITPA